MDFGVTIVKDEHITTACNSCFSRGRVLSPLDDCEDLFMYLLGDLACSIDPRAISVCWECLAALKNMRRFQWKVQQAQFVLQQMLNNEGISPTPLTNLCKMKLENINIETSEIGISQNDFEKEFEIPIQELKENVKLLTDKKGTIKKYDVMKVENDSDYEPISEYLDDNSDYLNASFNTPSPAAITEKSKQTKTKKSKIKIKSEPKTETGVKKKRAPRGKLNVTFNNTGFKSKHPDVDIKNFMECFKKSVLTEEQIEKLGTVMGDKRKRYRAHKYYCEKCRKDFLTTVDLNRHTTFCHILKEEFPGPFKCLYCDEECPDQTSLRSHWQYHNVMTICKLCDAILPPTSTMMREHAKTHIYVWTCKICPDVKKFYVDFSYHYRTIHKQSICDYCGKKFASKGGVLRHIRSYHTVPICKICNQKFKDYKILRGHYYLFHPELVNKAVKPECTYCVECNKQFPSVAKYRKHLNHSFVHNPQLADTYQKTTVPCPDCGKVFSRKSYMNNHYKLTHIKKTNHCCELCGKYLFSAWALKKHIQGVHHKIRDPKTKICDICGTAFQTNAVLKKHIRTHTGERPYKCAHCPAAFAQSSALTSHTRTQHKQA